MKWKQHKTNKYNKNNTQNKPTNKINTEKHYKKTTHTHTQTNKQ